MKASLVDTNILSLFFRGHPQVVAKFEAYLKDHDTINFSIITYYEIVSGLKHRDAHSQLSLFIEFAAQNTIISLTRKVADVSAEVYADLRKSGQPIDDIDLLIAGTAIANGLTFVTDNQKHFDRIDQLDVENWARDTVD
ncbi:MAG: type II toxin-antitoxin system VapC family toxin [Anaerolineae bacterium]|nr:type II toxin-antitoxin system VapC family toxin [Anaerolineae bacterium]